MSHRKHWRELLREGFLILSGSFIYAIGIDCFELPNGLAAGGLTGLATIVEALAREAGIVAPVGAQTIVMNGALLLYVYLSTRDKGYVAQSIVGILASGFFVDALAPILPVPAQGELLLSAIWGGVVVGVGIGVVFLSGGNTGGTDIVGQLLARRTGLPVGLLCVLADGAIVLLSVPVFSLRNALYAGIAMYVSGVVIDMVLDGPRTARIVYVISQRHEEIADKILYELGRGCTELQARGVWSGNSRPVLMCVLGRSETMRLKGIVAQIDPDAIVIVSEAHEAFGEGFMQIDPS